MGVGEEGCVGGVEGEEGEVEGGGSWVEGVCLVGEGGL